MQMVICSGRRLLTSFQAIHGSINFPMSNLSIRLRLWEKALVIISGGNGLIHCSLGSYVVVPHLPTEWYVSDDRETLYFCPCENIRGSHDVFCLAGNGNALQT